MKPDIYISVDIESSGPIPGKYSMLSIGACLVGNTNMEFYVELKPISKNFVAKALEVSGFELAQLEREGKTPEEAMNSFRRWVEEVSIGGKPVFVGFNACYDWQFINWYFETYTAGNPFGFGGIDIKSYYMGLSGMPWSKSTSSQLPEEYRPDVPQTHNALDDARAQSSIFEKLRRKIRK